MNIQKNAGYLLSIILCGGFLFAAPVAASDTDPLTIKAWDSPEELANLVPLCTSENLEWGYVDTTTCSLPDGNTVDFVTRGNVDLNNHRMLVSKIVMLNGTVSECQIYPWQALPLTGKELAKGRKERAESAAYFLTLGTDGKYVLVWKSTANGTDTKSKPYRQNLVNDITKSLTGYEAKEVSRQCESESQFFISKFLYWTQEQQKALVLDRVYFDTQTPPPETRQVPEEYFF